MGKNVKIYLLLGDDFSGDALINYNILKSMKADFCEISLLDERDILLADCVVDAIFGTGFHGKASENIANVIEKINKNASFVLSVDIPSGVNADTGEIDGATVSATETVTFAAYKRGLLLYPGAEYAGKVKCVDISIPKEAFVAAGVTVNTSENIVLPKRSQNSHKGDYGKIFIIGGNRGMSGAVILAAEAAFKTGAGIVTACVPGEISDIIDIASPMTMTFAADFEKDFDKILSKMKGFDVILFGNGIGREPSVGRLLEKVLKEAEVPVVLDADGLFALAENPDMIKESKAEIILTPHSAEMGRLIGESAEFVEKNRFLLSYNFAREFGVTLILKGHHSIITAASGEQTVNLTGNSGMATAGSGDVLAGMIAALAAVMKPCDAAIAGVYLHALAGDFAAKALSCASVTARDIQDSISRILPVENT